jgi:hypothetical protein
MKKYFIYYEARSADGTPCGDGNVWNCETLNLVTLEAELKRNHPGCHNVIIRYLVEL